MSWVGLGYGWPALYAPPKIYCAAIDTTRTNREPVQD